MAIGQSLAVSVQVPAGLGQHELTLTPLQIQSYEKVSPGMLSLW